MRTEARSRLVGVPQVLEVERGNLARIAEIIQQAGCPVGHTLVLSGSGATSDYADVVRSELVGSGFRVLHRTVERATEAGVGILAQVARESGIELIVGVGGGRVLDTAKSVAQLGGIHLVSVPTSLSHDGISSPVASLLDRRGRRVSVPAAVPTAVIIDVDVIETAPLFMLRAGVGDLLSNLSAIEDWQLASTRGHDPFDAYSALIADGAARPMLTLDSLTHRGSTETLAKGLMLSGLAMITAGTSRPCSGAEHLISHALDHILGRRARLHGEQVALGTLVASAARGATPTGLRAAYERCGLPVAPTDVGIDVDVMVEAVMLAPATRPNRYTVLSEMDMSRAGATDLVNRAFAA